MKNLILIIGVVLCCAGAYAADRTSQEPVFALDDLGSGIVSAPALTDEQLADILRRCLEYVPEDPPGVYYVGNHEDKRRQLRGDIERVLRVLNGANQWK